MTRAAEMLEPSSPEPQDREPSPGSQSKPQLGRLVDRIKDDAREQSGTYLRETVVPEGGE